MRAELESVQAQEKSEQRRRVEQRAANLARQDPAVAATHRALDPAWRAALRSVEQASQSPIFLLALRVSVAEQLLRMEAEAETLPQALDYVESLNTATGLKAALRAHSTVTRPTGQSAVRFVVETTMQRGLP